ncbi:MAG: hypothetical protein DCC67_00735 [Planctomycetota bacterium]|nr:MAG: hypothetical protein DCC67_00735 [Planctomycetota bacterium]
MTKPLARSLVVLLLAAAASAPAHAIERQTGRLAELIAQLASRQYVLGEPSRDARPYVDPAPVLHAFRHVAAAMAWGDVAVAARKAQQFDYELVKFTDAETKRDYYVLREDLDVVKTIRGWGSYIINPASQVDALVEVPHPMADVHTPEIGGRVFAECQAKGFLLAGTHRDKADVPDLVDSIFHQVHAAWIGPLAQVTAWQIHGFLSANHPFPQGTQVVASTGDGAIAPEIATLDATLEQRGLAAYAFNRLPAEASENREVNGDVPGLAFTSLAAAKNEQGRLSRSLGGAFVHIELEGDVRASAASRQAVSSAIAEVIRSAAIAAKDRPANVQLAAAQPSSDEQAPAAVPAAANTPAEKPPVRLAVYAEKQNAAERLAPITP